MSELEIRKCPFCRGKDCRVKQYNPFSEYSYFCVTCHACHADGPSADTKEEAIRLWNAAFGPLEGICKDKIIEWLAQAAANVGWQGHRVSASDMIIHAQQAVQDWYNKEKQKEQNN